jgi:hypothetical protein
MSGKRPSLAETMRQAVRPESDAVGPQSAPALPVLAPLSTRPATGFFAATRAGKKKVTAALDPAMHKQLKSLAVEREVTTEALLVEAIADLFAKYGMPARQDKVDDRTVP